MAQVPYTPVPDVVPQVPAPPKIGVDTPPAAFGVTTAEAESRLGGQVEKTGDMLAQNALMLQSQRNETWARDDFVKQSAKLGEIEANYYSLKGADAVAQRPKYEQDVQNLYTDAINNAPNPQARRMLGDVLSRRVSYSIVDGQRHAGDQESAYRKGVNVNTVAEAQSDIAQHPYDDRRFNENIAKQRSTAADQAKEDGTGSSGYDRRIEQYVSQSWEYRLQSIASENPDRARQLYEAHKNEIKGIAQNGEPYLLKIKKMIDTQDVRLGTRVTAHDILFGGAMASGGDIGDVEDALQNDKSLTPAQRAGGAPLPTSWLKDHGVQTLNADSGDDFLQKALQTGQRYVQDNGKSPEFEDELYRRITQDYNTFANAAKRAVYGSFVNVAGAVAGANGGAPITRMDDIYNNPNLNAEWSKLSDTAYGRDKQRQIKTMVDNQFKKGSLGPEEQNFMFNKIMGLGVEAERDQTKRDEFTKLDFGDLSGKLGAGYMKQLQDEQRHVQRVWEGKAENLERNNRLSSAMTVLKPMLKDAGLDPNSTSQEVRDRYLSFEGALYRNLSDYEQKTQKPLTDQAQIMGIGSRLLQETESNWFARNKRAFEVPSAQREAITKIFGARAEYAGRTPSPFEIGDIYQRILATPAGSPWRKSIGLD